MILRAQAKQHWAGTLSLMWTILRNTLYWKKEDSTLNDSIQKIKPCRKQNNNNYLYKRVDNMSTDKRYSFELINFICCYTIIQTLFFIMLTFLAHHLHINIVFDVHVLILHHKMITGPWYQSVKHADNIHYLNHCCFKPLWSYKIDHHCSARRHAT